MLQLKKKKKKNGLGMGRDGRETMVAWTRVEAVGSDSIRCILGKLSQQDLLVEVKERHQEWLRGGRLSLLLIHEIERRVS